MDIVRLFAVMQQFAGIKPGSASYKSITLTISASFYTY